MANSNSKGDSGERELVNLLHDDGWAVMRAPSSGSATERELPDVLAGNGGEFYAFEVKRGKREKPIYIEDHEVEGLHYFASHFGARPRLAIRFDYTDWAFLKAADVHRTPSGKNYRVKHDDIATTSPVRLRDDVPGISDLA